MNGNGHKPIVIAMSGGVDSSTAAALLAERQPGAVIGLTMQLWDQRRLQGNAANPAAAVTGGLEIVHAGRCCSLDDAYDARRVAGFLGLPYYLINFEARFEAAVVRPFVETYLAGETPIPCTLCNNFIKFDHLLTTARQIGAERLATGHYARLGTDPATGRYQLRRARDASKDQSYFLFGLTQEQLACTEFPLGDLTKREVRELARTKKLPVAEKLESQEICFVPSGNYIGFIEEYLRERGQAPLGDRGEIVGTDGTLLGEHSGLHQFTLGQRRGLGLAAGKPLYVVALDRARNRVIVGEERNLLQREARARDANWISIAPPRDPLRARVKVRHKHRPAAATLYPEGKVADARDLRLVFDEPQRALTPGQAAVFYALPEAPDPDLVLGGAWLS
ncbi:MAG: tRNA 2-thiouridine(34) synthase MnmA [Terriglobia bacterium]